MLKDKKLTTRCSYQQGIVKAGFNYTQVRFIALIALREKSLIKTVPICLFPWQLCMTFYSGDPAEHHNYRNRATCMHRNRKPCNSFHGEHGWRTPNDDVAQHGSHTTANTKSCSLGLQHTSLILDIHVMVNKPGYLPSSIT